MKKASRFHVKNALFLFSIVIVAYFVVYQAIRLVSSRSTKGQPALLVGSIISDCTKAPHGSVMIEDNRLDVQQAIMVGMNEMDCIPLLEVTLGNPQSLAVKPPKDETGRYKRLYFFRNGPTGVIQITSKISDHESIWVIDEILLSNQFEAIERKEDVTDWESVVSIDLASLEPIPDDKRK